ncbi:hypothetical protein NHQ30_005425 [Ciborinia camelliae]|nr:hypothetical protein NHQ30_005425 [Ciborinia camelliae]
MKASEQEAGPSERKDLNTHLQKNSADHKAVEIKTKWAISRKPVYVDLSQLKKAYSIKDLLKKAFNALWFIPRNTFERNSFEKADFLILLFRLRFLLEDDSKDDSVHTALSEDDNVYRALIKIIIYIDATLFKTYIRYRDDRVNNKGQEIKHFLKVKRYLNYIREGIQRLGVLEAGGIIDTKPAYLGLSKLKESYSVESLSEEVLRSLKVIHEGLNKPGLTIDFLLDDFETVAAGQGMMSAKDCVYHTIIEILIHIDILIYKIGASGRAKEEVGTKEMFLIDKVVRAVYAENMNCFLWLDAFSCDGHLDYIKESIRSLKEY